MPHFPLQVDVMLIDRMDFLGWPTDTWFAESGKNRFDYLFTQG
jgi:hypothetical protein